MTQKNSVIGWTRFIGELYNPIITGYNILGFDFDFIWKGWSTSIVDKFALLGQLKRLTTSEDGKRQKNGPKPSELIIKKLSSALGDNI